LQECLKAFSLYRFETMSDKPLLRQRQAIPAGERSRKGNLLPLGMKRRVLQSRKFREEGINEQRKPTRSVSPPSAWAVAKRDAPQIAEQCWTHGFPAGPKGRFAPYLPFFWAIWAFSKNKQAAKSLLAHLSQRSSIEKLVVASGGYDLPAYEKYTALKVWAEAEPPKGTLYHYPNPYNHQQLSIAAWPAPPKVAMQINVQATLTKMCLRYSQGEAMEKTLAWAEGECEGFLRT
jgi:hypothetical protein